MFDFYHRLKSWISSEATPSALASMKLGPDGSDDNPSMIQFFTWDSKIDGTSWWRHLENEIPKLAEAGITQVWVPPPNKAMEKDGRGYDAYDVWDLGEFDQKGQIGTRWGTKAELLQASAIGKTHGVDLLIDAVLNHKMGGDRKESFPAVPVKADNRLKVIGKAREIEGWTAFDFPGRGDEYSKLRWTQKHFSGLDSDERTGSKDIYKIVGEGHDGWSKNVDHELGNYDYLLGIDINHRHPEVREDLLRWGQWVIQTTGAIGFRLDAIKHIDWDFLLDFLRSTKQATNPRLFVVSEYWSPDLKRVMAYIHRFKGETAFFDVPLHMNFHQASLLGSRYDLRKIMSNTIAKARPGDAVTFVDNHDTVKGQSLESWENSFKIHAYALILLRPEGYPCIFYGDLYLNTECYNERISAVIKLLIEARKKFAYGSIKDYLKDRNCIGFVREGDAKHSGCVVVISNSERTRYDMRMNVGRNNKGRTFKSFLTAPDNEVKTDGNGWGVFHCVPGSVQVWIPF
ncbi:glycoside hydrolase family 13 protein, partial [Marasmius fiardii PR-910]